MNEHPTRLTNEKFMPSSSFGVFHDVNTESVGLHWHEFYEMSFIVAGTGLHVLNGQSSALVPGSIFLLTPADFHAVHPDADAPLEIFNVIFAAEKLPAELRQALFAEAHPVSLVAQLTGGDYESMLADYRRLLREHRGSQLGAGIVIQGTLERMLVDVARHCRQPEPAAPRAQESRLQHAIHQALIYMQHHFREKLSLESVSGHVGLSPHYFSECFHKMTGFRFQHYLQQLRLQFAKALLLSSDLPVTDICYASGFNTLPHFEKSFKQYAGISPRDFRKRQHPVETHEPTGV